MLFPIDSDPHCHSHLFLFLFTLQRDGCEAEGQVPSSRVLHLHRLQRQPKTEGTFLCGEPDLLWDARPRASDSTRGLRRGYGLSQVVPLTELGLGLHATIGHQDINRDLQYLANATRKTMNWSPFTLYFSTVTGRQDSKELRVWKFWFAQKLWPIRKTSEYCKIAFLFFVSFKIIWMTATMFWYCLYISASFESWKQKKARIFPSLLKEKHVFYSFYWINKHCFIQQNTFEYNYRINIF